MAFELMIFLLAEIIMQKNLKALRVFHVVEASFCIMHGIYFSQSGNNLHTVWPVLQD